MDMKAMLKAKMVRVISEIPNFYQLTPQELQDKTNIPQENWRDFLDEESTRQHIHRRITEDTEVAQRKALNALSKEAQRGNVQAIKELNQLAGIMNQNNNKQFITHYVPRPTLATPPTPPKTQEVQPQNESM